MAHIALVTFDYPPERGGVARYLSNLVQASNGELDAFVRKRPIRFFAWLAEIPFIRSLARRGYTFVLVSHALPIGTAAWISRLTGGPKYAILFHGLDFRLALSSRRKSWVLKRVLRHASLVIANSQFVADEIRAFDPTVTPLILTPGVEQFDMPNRGVARQRLGIGADKTVVLTVARLVPRKGIDTLIKCLADLPSHTQLVVIGDGKDRRRLEHLAEPVKNRVRFISNATDETRNVWYAAADIFALPARDEGRDVEGFGIVCLEAAVAGLPVIAGKSGGMAEAVVNGVTGLLVDPNDATAVASALQTLTDDPVLRRQLGQAGRERALKDFRLEERWLLLKKKIVV